MVIFDKLLLILDAAAGKKREQESFILHCGLEHFKPDVGNEACHEDDRTGQNHEEDHPHEAFNVLDLVVLPGKVEEAEVDDHDLHADREELQPVQLRVIKRLFPNLMVK